MKQIERHKKVMTSTIFLKGTHRPSYLKVFCKYCYPT